MNCNEELIANYSMSLEIIVERETIYVYRICPCTIYKISLNIWKFEQCVHISSFREFR